MRSLDRAKPVHKRPWASLSPIAALGSILAGCSEFVDPVETYRCSDVIGGYYTVIYDSTTQNPVAPINGGVSLCGGSGCNSTLEVLVVGEVITFVQNSWVYVLDRGANKLSSRRKRADRAEDEIYDCTLVPNGTR